MNYRCARHTLWCLSGLLAVSCAGSVLLSALLPLEESRPEAFKPAPGARWVSAEVGPKDPPLERLVSLAGRPLRQRLFDPPVVPPPLPPKKPPPAVILVGTILQSQTPKALLRDAEGKVRFKRLGENVGDASNPATLKTIEVDHVTLEHEGTTFELRIEKRARKP